MSRGLIRADHRGEYRIALTFADGTTGEVDLKDELWGDMFEPLRDIARFKAFTVHPEFETLAWPNGADFAPEFLYGLLRPEYKASAPSPASISEPKP